MLFLFWISLAAASVNWKTAAGRAKMCQESGVGCKEPNATRVAEIFHARHGKLAQQELEPVILVPGLAGSGIEASIDKNYKV